MDVLNTIFLSKCYLILNLNMILTFKTLIKDSSYGESVDSAGGL